MVNPLRNKMFEGDKSRRGRREQLRLRRTQAEAHVSKVGEASPQEKNAGSKKLFPPKTTGSLTGPRSGGLKGAFRPPAREKKPLLSEAGSVQGKKVESGRFSVSAQSKRDRYDLEVVLYC